MKIERATLRDVPEILELQYRAFCPVCKELDWSDAPTVTETIEQAYADFPNSTVLKMGADDGRIIGSVRGKTDNGSLYIGRLMVLPEFQKKGYGKILLREIQSVMPHKRAWLGTSGETEKTIAFYKREGFSIFNTETLDNGHTWISMEKIRL